MDQLDPIMQAKMAAMVVPVFVGIGAFYIFMAFCMAKMATKLGMSFGGSFVMALIPLLNVILLLQMANKPLWWVLLFFVPLVNLVISVVMWMAIAERRGKPGWWGVVMLLPGVNLIFFLMLAFGA